MLDAALLSLFAALFFSLNLVLMRRCLLNVDLIKGTFVATWVAIPILAAACVASGEILNLGLLDASTILLLGLGGVLHFALGRTLQYSSAKTVGATRAMTLTSTNVIYSPILGILILGEIMTPTLVVGIICVIIGSWVILLSTVRSDIQPSARAPTATVPPVLDMDILSLKESS